MQLQCLCSLWARFIFCHVLNCHRSGQKMLFLLSFFSSSCLVRKLSNNLWTCRWTAGEQSSALATANEQVLQVRFHLILYCSTRYANLNTLYTLCRVSSSWMTARWYFRWEAKLPSFPYNTQVFFISPLHWQNNWDVSEVSRLPKKFTVQTCSG